MGSLLDNINKLSSMNNENSSFEDPFITDNNSFNGSIDIEKFTKEHKIKKQKKSAIDDLDTITSDFESSFDDIINVDDFIESLFENNEDNNLRNQLVDMGRKYARDHTGSNDENDIAKNFSPQENALKGLINEIDKDTVSVQKDIENIRMARTRNSKTLSELISSKTSLHSAKLSAIKEINTIKKNIIDLSIKTKGNKNDDLNTQENTARTIQQIIKGEYRDSIIESTGGRSASIYEYEKSQNSNYTDNIDDIEKSLDDNEELIQKKYFNDYEETEADKYIKYEEDGVQLHLMIDKNDNKMIVAKNRNNEIVPDYPLPPNPEDLLFDIQNDLGTAKDQLHRNYILEMVDDI